MLHSPEQRRRSFIAYSYGRYASHAAAAVRTRSFRETAKSAGPGYTRHNTTAVAVQASGKGTLMLGSNMRLVIGGFAAVAVEADWPDAYRVNRYVQGRSNDADANEALGDFKRFPTWMWRNADVLDFVG